MGKFLVRITIAITAIHFIISYIYAQFFGIDVFTDFYIVLFELCVVIYCFSEGKYHCRYIKFVALAILMCDILTRLDNAYDFLSVSAHNFIPLALLATSIGVGITKAFIHFYRVLKLKRHGRTKSNKTNGYEYS